MKDWKTKRKTTIGGQALIEGVMMRGPEYIAIAVRKPDSEIIVEKSKSESYSKKYKVSKLPFIRGSFVFIESIVVGIKALTFSAKFFDDDEEKPGKFELLLKRLFGEKVESVVMGFSLLISLFFTIALFFVFPSVVMGLLNKLGIGTILKNLVEGTLRIFIFIIYLLLISRMNDIKRVFQYHGAEHKTIFCYENQEELTVENVRKYTTLHPRCGTNFMFIVLIVSIFVFSFFGWPGIVLRIVSRVLLLPVVAGVSYEILRFVGRTDSKFIQTLVYPGLLFQKLTTSEPDDSQLEVAIAALKAVIVEDKDADTW